MSLEVRVDDQGELDRVWAALVDGGTEMPCGWLKDRYGVSWQVTPARYEELMVGEDDEAKQRLMTAVLATVGKFDIAALAAAYAGETGSRACRAVATLPEATPGRVSNHRARQELVQTRPTIPGTRRLTR